MKKIVAVVVTYNRLYFLKKCLQSLLQQSYPLNKIVVIDNASTDDTLGYMKENFSNNEKIDYVRLSSNLGGSGGFSTGIKEAMTFQNDYIWLMDDDTIPTDGALEKLLLADDLLNGQWSFLASNVRWTDGGSAKMNQLTTAKFWSEYISQGLVAVQTGTFVSLLIKRVDVIDIGLPIADFFIWGDDTEYTMRLSDRKKGYFVSDSIVIHETKSNSNVNIINERNENRISRYFYSFRNSYYIASNEHRRFKYVLRTIITSITILKSDSKNKLKKLHFMYKGLFAGFFFHPKIEKVNK